MRRHCTGSGYRHHVAARTRKNPTYTPQHTVRVDDDLWDRAAHIAKKRREKVSDALRRALVEYVDEHDALLDDFEPPARADG